MDLFDNPAELAKQLAEVEAELDALDDGSDSSVLLERLRHQSPNHPLLWAKTVFALAVVLGGITAIALAVLPGYLETAQLQQLNQLEQTIGLPLVPVAGAISGVSLVLWFITSQLLLFLARGIEPLEWEVKERNRLTEDIARIRAAQHVHAGSGRKATPMGAVPRTATPIGAPPLAMLGMGTPPPLPGMRATPAPVQSNPNRASGLLKSLGAKSRGGTPLGAAPRGGDAANSLGGELSYSGPTGSFDAFDDDAEFPDFDKLAPSQAGATPAYTVTESEQRRPELLGGNAGFGRQVATVWPQFGDVSERWMSEALERCHTLATQLPVQAAIQFNEDENLPFTLMMERASPAIAARAVLAYAEFLSKIATPARGRVDLAAVPHVANNFRRSVVAALEPHFGDNVEITKRGDVFELTFRRPDPCWADFPKLPIVA